ALLRATASFLSRWGAEHAAAKQCAPAGSRRARTHGVPKGAATSPKIRAELKRGLRIEFETPPRGMRCTASELRTLATPHAHLPDIATEFRRCGTCRQVRAAEHRRHHQVAHGRVVRDLGQKSVPEQIFEVVRRAIAE